MSDKKPAKNVLIFLLLLSILFNLFLNVINAINTHIDYDEWQHIHITWNVFNNKIIYKDFFEHHGPIYPLINSFFFSLFNLKPEFDTIYFFRFLNITYSLILLFLSFKIGKIISGNFFGGLFSAVLLSSLFLFQIITIQVRPDPLQNLFWLLCIFLFVKSIKEEQRNFILFAGIFSGLAFLTNPKALICAGAVILYFIFSFFVFKEERKKLIINSLIFISGNAISFFLVSLYCLMNEAFSQFIFYNYEFNIVAALKYHLRHLKRYAEYYLSYEILFPAFSIVSLFYFIRQLIKKKIYFDNKILLFFIVISLVTPVVIFFGLYATIYLIFLPLFSIIISSFITDLYNPIKNYNKKKFLLIIPVLLLFLQLIFAKILLTNFSPEKKLVIQKEMLSYVLTNSKRDEPMLFVWDDAGGYVFNADLQYFWCENENFKDYFTKITGYNPYGENLIKKLKKNNVKFIIGDESRLEFVLSSEAFDYVLKNYTESKKYENLWIRNY